MDNQSAKGKTFDMCPLQGSTTAHSPLFWTKLSKQKIMQLNSAQVKRNNACNIMSDKLILHFGAKFQH